MLNHEWWKPETFVSLGHIDAERVAELSDGRLDQPVEVVLNRAVVEHDVSLVVGPVFPHEVVGFSGGNKYFFPGVAGQEVIDFSHWLGALITSADIIGTPRHHPGPGADQRGGVDDPEPAARAVPGRAVRDQRVARRLLRAARGGVGGLRRGLRARPTCATWTHRCGGCCPIIPTKYEDMWTGAKGFYKVEPVVADGGQVIIYAPHITEISAMHPVIQEIGYHCRDYFLGQWDRSRTTTGATSRTPPTCAVPAPRTPRTASGAGSPSPWPPAYRRTSSAPSNLDYLDPAPGRHRGADSRPGHARPPAGR